MTIEYLAAASGGFCVGREQSIDASESLAFSPLAWMRSRNSNPTNGPLPCTTCGNLRSVCQCRRDLITGAPVWRRADTVVVYVQEQMYHTKPRYLDRDEDAEAAIPLRLHSRETEGVGLRYTTAYERLLDAGLSEQQRWERQELDVWWEEDYCRDRVRRDMRELFGSPPRADRVYSLMVRLACDEMSEAEAAEEMRVPLARIIEWARLTQRLAKRPSGRRVREWTRHYRTPAMIAA